MRRKDDRDSVRRVNIYIRPKSRLLSYFLKVQTYSRPEFKETSVILLQCQY